MSKKAKIYIVNSDGSWRCPDCGHKHQSTGIYNLEPKAGNRLYCDECVTEYVLVD